MALIQRHDLYITDNISHTMYNEYKWTILHDILLCSTILEDLIISIKFLHRNANPL